MEQIEKLKVFKRLDNSIVTFKNMLMTLEYLYSKDIKKWTQKNISDFINCYLSYNLRNNYYLLIDAYFLINLTKIYIKYLKGNK